MKILLSILLLMYVCKAQPVIESYEIKFWKVDVPTTPPHTFAHGDTMKFMFEDGDETTVGLPDPPIANPVLAERSIIFPNDTSLWGNGSATVRMESVQLPAGKWVVAVRSMAQNLFSQWSQYLEIQVVDRIRVPKNLIIVIE